MHQTALTTRLFLEDTIAIAHRLLESQGSALEGLICELVALRARKGRVFFIGVGGSAANCAHAVNDFRKIAGIESYSVSENVSELTARVNDEGWDTAYSKYLEGSNLDSDDAVFCLSVGGGNLEKKVSINLIEAMRYAKNVGAKVLGIVGPDGGFTAQTGDHCVKIPVPNTGKITAQAEAWQGVLLHLIVSDPRVAVAPTKWESIKRDDLVKAEAMLLNNK